MCKLHFATFASKYGVLLYRPIGSITARHSTTIKWASDKLCGVARGTRNGITELSQTAPSSFDWAVITLIGHWPWPHSSCLYCAKTLTQLQCGPMSNVMAALLNIRGVLCSTPQRLADAHYQSAVTAVQ